MASQEGQTQVLRHGDLVILQAPQDDGKDGFLACDLTRGSNKEDDSFKVRHCLLLDPCCVSRTRTTRSSPAGCLRLQRGKPGAEQCDQQVPFDMHFSR